MPLMLDEGQWQFMIGLFEESSWEKILRGAKRVVDEGEDEHDDEFIYFEVRLTLEDLDALWESVSSAMDAHEDDDEVELLDSVLRNIGVAMDGF